MKRNLWMLLVLPALLAAFVGLGSAYAQDGTTDPAQAPVAEAPSAGAPAGEADAPAASTKKPIDVNAVIAEFNAGRPTPQTFSEEERGWIGMGMAPGDVELVDKGYVAIPSDDPYVVKYRRNGKDFEIRSDPSTGTPPSGAIVSPFAPETDNRPNIWMSTAASSTAVEVDAMFNFIMWTCYIFTALILVAMIWLCVRYRRRPGVRADQSHTHNTPLEITWSVIPTILCAIMFWGGYVTFLDMRTPPPDAMTVNVNAFRWGWKFVYSNGVESPHEIHVPANTPIELVMTSSDVIHSFHVPVYRQKSDILPNRYTKIWFESGEPGTYRIYCTEYCGKGHGDMYAKLVVEPQADFDAWLVETGNWMVDENGELLPPLEIGELTYTRQGCNACHSLDGADGTGPTFKGLWGKTRTFADGTSRVADENYVRQSILDPHSQIVVENGKNYGAQMSLFPNFPEEQISGIIALLKSLKD